MSLLTIGGGLSLSFTHHALFAPIFTDSLTSLLASFVPPILAAGATLALLAFTTTSDVETAQFERAVVWYLGGAATLGVAVYISFTRNIPGRGLSPDTWFALSNWIISGSVIGLVVANYDLRRTAALRQARATQRKADRIAQQLSVLNRVLRHDVRNRTNIILGYVQQIQVRSEHSAATSRIETAASSLSDIADRVRQVQAVVEDEFPHPVDLTACVTDLVQNLRAEYPAAQISPDVEPDVTVHTYSAIRPVLEDLLENAIEHNSKPEPQKVVTVTVRQDTTGTEASGEVVIEDNGPGIPERERVVLSNERETQLDHSTGTSLWLTRWVIDESGGEFDISSDDGAGTCIRLRLPTADE